MTLLKIYQGRRLEQALAEIITPVQVTYAALDQPEPDTLAALAELQTLTPHLSVSLIHQPTEPADRVSIRGEHGGELIFIGPPLGTELAALVSAIIVAGRGASGLTASTRQTLSRLQVPVHMEIFTTPTWPNCSQAVSLVHKFAFESPRLIAAAISAVALPDLARDYKVLGTPHLVINGTHHLRGRLAEESLLRAIGKTLNLSV